MRKKIEAAASFLTNESAFHLSRTDRYNVWLHRLVATVFVCMVVFSILMYLQKQHQIRFNSIQSQLQLAGDDLLFGLTYIVISRNFSEMDGNKGETLILQAAKRYQSAKALIEKQHMMQIPFHKLDEFLVVLQNIPDELGSLNDLACLQRMHELHRQAYQIRQNLDRQLQDWSESYRRSLELIMYGMLCLTAIVILIQLRLHRYIRVASQALIESERRFRQLTENITDVFWLYERQSEKTIYVSPAFYNIWGGRPSENAKETWFDSIVDEDKARVKALMFCFDGQPVDIEYRIYGATGEIRWIRDLAFPIFDNQKNIIRIAGVARDITEERKKQEQLLLLNTAVSKLNDIVMISEVPADGLSGPKVVFVNRAFESITGYTADEIIGRTPSILHGEKTDRIEIQRIRKALEAWQPVHSEVTNYTKCGKEIRLELNIVPVSNESGRFTHWVSIERDVTQRRKLEEQLYQARKMEALGQFTSGIAHDFNNLLTVILGSSDLLEQQLEAQPHLEKLAKNISVAAESGSELTAKLLGFAREQVFTPKLVNLKPQLSKLIPILESAMGKSVELSVDFRQQSDFVLIDVGLFENAILNLCLNAKDAMNNMGKLQISLSNQWLEENDCVGLTEVSPGYYVCVTIADSGAGIPPDILPRVFEPLFTTKEKGKGTGLGLSMVFGFVKQSRGHAQIDSRLGIGTSVKLFLPVAEEDRSEHVQSDTSRLRESRAVMIVEPDNQTRQRTAEWLRQGGYRAIEASNGEAALSLMEQEPVPEMYIIAVLESSPNHHDLLNKIRQLHSEIPVVLSAGHLDSIYTVEQVVSLQLPVLNKPYTKSKLLARIKELLR